MRILKQHVLQWFVPAELRENARAELQAFRAIVFGLAMVFWAPVFAPIYYLMGSIRASGMVALVAAALLAGCGGQELFFYQRVSRSLAFPDSPDNSNEQTGCHDI